MSAGVALLGERVRVVLRHHPLWPLAGSIPVRGTANATWGATVSRVAVPTRLTRRVALRERLRRRQPDGARVQQCTRLAVPKPQSPSRLNPSNR